jgi:outer membrane lipoprotein SlyB
MTHPTQWLRVAIFALVGVGLASAVVLGRGRGRRTATIPAGTSLVAALDREVSTEQNRPGDQVELRTVSPIPLGHGEALPAGVTIHATVTEAKGGGRIAGAPQLGLRFTDLEVDGARHAISAEPFHVSGKNDAGKSAAQIGGGAVAGAILGRIVGGKGGTAKGAVVGAAAGTGVAVATPGGHLVLPAGQRLRVRLDGPVTVAYQPREDRRHAAGR